MTNNMYHSDSYITEVALHNHQCFGRILPSDRVCTECSATKECYLKMCETIRSHFSRTAAVTEGDGCATPPQPSKHEVVRNKTVVEFITPADIICDFCGNVVPRGEAAVRSVENGKKLNFHRSCVVVVNG